MRRVPLPQEIRFFSDTCLETLVFHGVFARGLQLTPHLLDPGQMLGAIVGWGIVHDGGRIGQTYARRYRGWDYTDS